MKKIAVVLFNLGGPDKADAVKPFLYNLFGDAAIIRLPLPLRQVVARLIASRRAAIAAAIYGQIGGGSPILPNTQKQAEALEAALSGGNTIKCFVAMRYWHPLAEETAGAVKKFAPAEILLLPLYPQFSTTTTASSFTAWKKAAAKAGLSVPTKTVCCYPEEPGFIEAIVPPLHAAYDKAKLFGRPRILFSAHGLPEKIIKAGDPYRFQCERTCTELARAAQISDLDWVLCYQSRVGPLVWIGPSTEQEIERAARDKMPVIVVPMAFVSEHSETLYEIDILYRELAAAKGVPYFDRVATVGASPSFIDGLAKLARKALNGSRPCISGSGPRLCPRQFSGCGMSGYETGADA